MKLTENFSLEEFLASETATLHKIPNTPNDAVVVNLKRLANYLQRIRNCYGKPIRINSGYRCKALNSVVGGAKSSQHVSGEAADITTGSKSENKRLFEIIRKIGGFDQMIDEKDYQWIHLSYRAGRLRGEVLRLTNGKYYKT